MLNGPIKHHSSSCDQNSSMRSTASPWISFNAAPLDQTLTSSMLPSAPSGAGIKLVYPIMRCTVRTLRYVARTSFVDLIVVELAINHLRDLIPPSPRPGEGDRPNMSKFCTGPRWTILGSVTSVPPGVVGLLA